MVSMVVVVVNIESKTDTYQATTILIRWHQNFHEAMRGRTMMCVRLYVWGGVHGSRMRERERAC